MIRARDTIIGGKMTGDASSGKSSVDFILMTGCATFVDMAAGKREWCVVVIKGSTLKAAGRVTH
jgi:hypothetical protein